MEAQTLHSSDNHSLVVLMLCAKAGQLYLTVAFFDSVVQQAVASDLLELVSRYLTNLCKGRATETHSIVTWYPSSFASRPDVSMQLFATRPAKTTFVIFL